jgi:hypothetical protein
VVSFSGRPAIDTLARIGSVPDADFEEQVGPPRDASEFARDDSPLLLIDVDPTSPEFRQARGLVVSYWEHDGEFEAGVSEYTLIAQPARPLRPKTRYAFFVTSDLRGADGEAEVRSARMDRVFAGEAEPGYAEQVAEALAVVAEAQAVAPERIALATSFTTASVHDELLAAVTAQRNAAAPALIAPWTLETPAHSDGRLRLRAMMEAPAYRAEDGRFVVDAGVPTIVGSEALEVFVAVSNGTQNTPRPVVIYAHGLAGDKDGSWGTAARLAELGVAVFAIDAPHHGSRGGGEVNAVITTTKFFGIDIEDQSFVLGRARDNFRQMALDQLSLVRLVASLGEMDQLPLGAPDGVPDFDVSRMLYVGHSFGAVQGATIFAVAPEIKYALWNVGGAGLTTLIRDSDMFTLLSQALRPPEMTAPALARFFAVAQAVLDPGDPLSFAAYGTGKSLVDGDTVRDVLLQEVIRDGIVPNTSSRALARAAGLELLAPIESINGLAETAAPAQGNLATGATAVITQFDRMNGDQVAQHGELIFSPEGHAQYLEFFKSGLAEGRARVVVSPSR